METELISPSFIKVQPLETKILEGLKKDINNDLTNNIKEISGQIQQHFDAGNIALVLKCGKEVLSISEFQALTVSLAKTQGQLLVQNEAGDKVISVFDRDRLGSMNFGARYHQTREGGSIHTDNVNIPELWDYLYLSCISPALVGGENILVNGIAVHKELKEKYPKALAILEEKFVWEMRGVSDSLYEAPIITYNEKGLPLFRHLRPYMESAHKKANKPFTSEQLFAIDVLDAVTNSSEFQTRYKMESGDILITVDAQVLHGRTCFSDSLEAVSLPDFLEGKGMILKRTMERMWIQK